jgi:hypothetical protein
LEDFLDEFAQLSWTALVEEARRRGVPMPDGMDREALLSAIQARPPGKNPLSRARSLIGRVVDTMRSALPGNERRSERPPPPIAHRDRPRQPTSSEPMTNSRLEDPDFHGIEFVDGDTLTMIWRVHPTHVERAQAVAAPGAEMRLRTIRISWPEHESEPLIEQGDRGPVRGEGEAHIPRRKNHEKVIVAIGLSSALGEFVAIDHATLG